MAGLIFSIASGVNDSVFGKSQEPIKAMLTESAEAYRNMSAVEKIFKKIDSKNFAEKFTYLTSFGDFAPTGEGGAYPQTEMQEGYSKVVEPDEWKSKFVITETMMEDAKLGDVRQAGSRFTNAYNRGREKFGLAMLGGATAATVALNIGGVTKTFNTATADGVALFSTAHTSKTSGTANQANLYANAFSVDAMSMVECAMQDYKDDNGNILNVSPDTIIIPNEYSLKRDVFAAIGADKDPATANNGFNYQFGRWNVIVTQYLPAAHKTGKYWMMLDSKFNDIENTLLLVDRVPLSVTSWIDYSTGNNVFNGRARYNVGFNNWRGIALSGAATGGTTLS